MRHSAWTPLIVFVAMCAAAPLAFAESWECEVYAPEREIVLDPASGAKLTFVTRSPARDANLYFHQRSWLPDSSMLFFHTDRAGRGEIFGYLETTGELVRLQKPGDRAIGHVSAGRFSNSLYMTRDKAVYEWSFDTGKPEEGKRTPVTVMQRLVGRLPTDMTGSLGLTENSNGRALVVGFTCANGKGRIVWMDRQTGSMKIVADNLNRASHIPASWTQPDLVMFASGDGDRAKNIPEGKIHSRLMLADLSGRKPWPIYPQLEGELVTHECFWVGDQLTFCSGTEADGYAEQAHVKVLDLSTGQSRIVGAGAFWEGGKPEEIAKLNWWHASGAPNGRWVAGDNWHGDIAIFSARTSRTRMLTTGHRTYGSGPHPHVGWDPTGNKVLFDSNRRGNSDVVIGEIPAEWSREDW